MILQRSIQICLLVAFYLIQSTAMVVDPGISSNLKYRPARRTDLSGIASLLTATFDDEIPEWNVIKLKLTQDSFQKQLENRMDRLVKLGAKHALIVAAINETQEIAGFMELGTMPSPIPIVTTWEGVEVNSRPDIPYLANLAISKNYRRQKLGSKLVMLAEKLSKKWCELDEDTSSSTDSNPRPAALFLAVEKENEAAIQMYRSLSFDVIIDETEKLSTETLRKMRRKPRLYFQKDLRDVEGQE